MASKIIADNDGVEPVGYFDRLRAHRGAAVIAKVLAHQAASEQMTVRGWRPKEGCVYFIESAAGPIKIGFSVDVSSRMKALRGVSPVALTLLATVAGPITRETAYHHQFAAHRLHGEWFEPAPEILAEIERLNSPASHRMEVRCG